MKTWGHSANNDAAAFRILEAGRSDDNVRELIGQSRSSEETELWCFLRTLGSPEQIQVSNRIKN